MLRTRAPRRPDHPAILACLLALAGCANQQQAETDLLAPPTLPRTKQEAVVETVAPRTVEEQLVDLLRAVAESAADFSLGKGDVLSISVYDESDLSLQSVPVRPDGKISFPLIGDVEVAGRNVDAVRQDITERLRQYLLEPRVAVACSSSAPSARACCRPRSPAPCA